MTTTKDLLMRARVIAVVGCSDKPWRDSHRIAAYLQASGYVVYPVNPALDTVLGVTCYPSVQAIPEKVDIVDVFRNPLYVPEIVEDAIAAGAGAIWLQLGVAHPEAERRAAGAGLDVISDLCIAVEHRLDGIPHKGE